MLADIEKETVDFGPNYDGSEKEPLVLPTRTELIQHDFDVTSFGIEHGVIPRMKESFFKADSQLVKLAENVAHDLFGAEKVKIV